MFVKQSSGFKVAYTARWIGIHLVGFLVLRRRNIQIALSIGLQLSFEEAESLMKSAGYAFSHSRKADVIVEYFF